jgi:tRNA modification GTPase
LPEDRALLIETAAKPRVLVRNKCDLHWQWGVSDLGVPHQEAPLLAVSATQGEGLPELEQTLVQQAIGYDPLNQDEVILTRARHRQSLDSAAANVRTAARALGQGTPLEFVAFDVTEAIRQVSEVLGEDDVGAVLDLIFSQFCIGK